jgi:PST family polysaccharide transporter
LWYASKWRPQLSCKFSELRSIWKYSSNLVVFNFINYFSRNTDSILIGRFLGIESLGLYNVAYRILIFPLQNLTFVVTRALLPVLARKQDDLKEVGRFYLRTLAIISALSAPMMFGLWALRAPIIEVLMGPKWEGVIPILAWFAPLGFFQSLLSTTGTALAAIGRTDQLRTQGIVNTALILAAFWVGLQFGLMGLVIAYSVVTMVISLGTLHYTLRAVHSNLAGLMRVLLAPTLCAALMAAMIVLCENFFAKHTIPIVRLVVLVPLGALLYAGLIRFFDKQIFSDLLRFVTRSAAKEGFAADPIKDLSNAG